MPDALHSRTPLLATSATPDEDRALKHELLARLEQAEELLAAACGQARDSYPASSQVRFDLGQARLLTACVQSTIRGELA